MGIEELAAAAVALLATKALEAVGGEAGKRLIGDLWDTVKKKFAGKEALVDFEQSPDDADIQAALRIQLKKTLAGEPELRKALAALVEEIGAKGGAQIIQNATASGGAKVAQIAGGGNVVEQ